MSSTSNGHINLTICDNYINGKFMPPVNGEYIDVSNPSTGTIIGKVALSNCEDVQAAVGAAEAVFPEWYEHQILQIYRDYLGLISQLNIYKISGPTNILQRLALR